MTAKKTAKRSAASNGLVAFSAIKPDEWCFEMYGKRGDTVLDLFGGSGSTLIACEKTERACCMMEMAPEYIDVIVARWEAATGQKAKKVAGA